MASKASSIAASPGPLVLSAHRTKSLHPLAGTVPCRLTWTAAPGIAVTSVAQSAGARRLISLTSEQAIRHAGLAPRVASHTGPCGTWHRRGPAAGR